MGVTLVDTAAQHEALLLSAGLLDETGRSILLVSGERAADMLHGLLTNDVKGMAVGAGLYAFMLTPKGRPVAELRVLRRESEFWLDMPDSCLESALTHLRKYLPPLYATFAETRIHRLSILGPRSASVIDSWAGGAVTGELPPLGSRRLEVGGEELVLVGREAIEGPGFDLYVGPEQRDEVLAQLAVSVADAGGREIGPEAWDILRVERGIPEWGRDFSEEDLAQETGQDARAISFDKGCYTGQEVVARIHFRGHVNRLVRGLRISGADAEASLEPSRPLFQGERERGLVTSPVESPRFGRIALGLVRTELEPGSRLALEPSGAEVVEVVSLPFDSHSAGE